MLDKHIVRDDLEGLKSKQTRHTKGVREKYNYLHFADEELRHKRDQATCPRSCIESVAEQGNDPTSPGYQSSALTTGEH